MDIFRYINLIYAVIVWIREYSAEGFMQTQFEFNWRSEDFG